MCYERRRAEACVDGRIGPDGNHEGHYPGRRPAHVVSCDAGAQGENGSLIQDFQEQKCSSAALVPLEIPRKPWPCACLMSS
jgi:hypothetical protein